MGSAWLSKAHEISASGPKPPRPEKVILEPISQELAGKSFPRSVFQIILESFQFPSSSRGLGAGLRGLGPRLRGFGSGLRGLGAGLRCLWIGLRGLNAETERFEVKPRSPTACTTKTRKNTRKSPKGLPKNAGEAPKTRAKRILLHFGRVFTCF